VDVLVEQALGRALGALRRRERSCAELYQWLLDRGVEAEIAEDVVAELVEVGELDDERFAFAFAQDKRDLSGWGAERIEAALVERGIARSLAERAGAEPHDSELTRAVDLALARGEDLGDERARARVLSFLIRRGYGYDLAYDAVREAARSDPAAA
jgi:regulatory protein